MSNFSYSSAATPTFVYAGTLLEQLSGEPQTAGYVYRTRTAVPAVYEATAGGGVGFDGSNDLGVSVNGAVFQFDDAASLADWIAGMQLAFDALPVLGLTISNPAGTTVRITGPADGTQYTLAPIEPSSPDLTLSAFTLVPDTGIAAPEIRPGMGVVFRDFLYHVEAPLPGSTLNRFAGVVLRESLFSDQTVLGLTGELSNPRKLIDENRARVARKGRMTLLAAAGETVTAGNDVYLGRLPSEAGYFFASQDLNNTRLQIAGATWIQSGTGDPAAEKGLMALFL